ncbi:TNF receptor-associated factor 2 [Paragonimus skrjabini miyazakii]|uniref:TNF receptor-associated factor 2 n=1 Tax=Paragonimus skrjabini miyazakii TaxID=59628 RepID=A0A8S9Z2P8_9TREM|nr:TNF receptor-associated factor 2 [Paragonimus skrjabini miyazakii]
MDDLHRLYEHQTMMAIGIYSFLDNLLAHIPSRTDNESGSDTEVDCPPIPAVNNSVSRFRPGVNELAEGLAEISRADTFRERQERIRLPPRLSTLTVSDGMSRRVDPVEASVESATEDVISPNEPIEPTSKADVTPGGYPEEMFIYLSEREKEEYTCAVCYSVLKEAYQCPNEHRFCYGCIYTWSTGPSAGHDGCPVCRCDGLYAKNFDLVDRINQKRTRCIQKGCNWMGLLAEHFSHEHRRYSAYELDLLLSSSSKEVASKSIEKSSQREVVIRKPTEDHMETSEPTPSVVTPSTDMSTNPVIGTLLPICQPLATSLESEVVEREQRATPQSMTHLRRDSRQSRITAHRSTSRRSSSSTSGNTTVIETPRTNILTPTTRSRLSQRQSPSTHFTVPPLMRPPLAVRVSRTHTTGSTQQSDSGHRSIGSQPVRRHARTQPRRPRSPVVPDYRPSDGASETGGAGDIQSSMRSPLPQSESRLLPFRTTPSSISHENALDCELNQQVSSPPPIIPTTSPASVTYVAARNQMYDSRITGVTSRTSENQAGNESDYMAPTSRSGNFILPAIHRNTTLTSQTGTRSYYDEVPSNENQTNDVNPENHVDQLNNARSREPRPLEFRRLVPRRQSRVVEQLRETREQLAAMLRLMTLELEERRQHVLAATLETASSSRLLRSLNSQITARQEVRHQEDTVRPIQETSGNDTEHNSSESRERQNHNPHDSLNVLRNLRTPERPSQVSSYQHTLQHLTNRMLGERIHHTEIHSDAVPLSFRYRLDGSQHQTDEAENHTASSRAAMTFGLPNPRLLARVRMDSTVSPVLFVAGRRNLGHLLSELRYPRATTTEWSSDEDDSDGDDDDNDPRT